MPLGELSVPSYLVPPSPVQRQQLDLEREQLRDRQRERASQQLMRAVGMAKMNKETQELIDQQVDPVTARKQAFLNNAHLLMPPGADISHFITQDEAQEVRRTAQQQLNDYRIGTLRERAIHDQEMADARLRAIENAEKNAETARDRDNFKQLYLQAEAARKLLRDQWELEIKKLELGQKAQEKQADRESREKIAGENTRLRMRQAMDKDEELKSLVSARDMERLNLRSAQDKVGKWWGAPSKDQLAIMEKRVKDADAAIEARRRQIRDEYGGNNRTSPVGEGVGDSNAPDTTPTAKPSTEEKVLVKDKNGKLFRLPKSQLNDALKQGYLPAD